MHGPVNDPNLNAAHPALLAGLRCNVDSQAPYRLQICAETHYAGCKEDCVKKGSEDAIIEAVQNSQNAKVGYGADYSNKRSPVAVNELKECNKGQAQLSAELRGRSTPYIFQRQCKRIISDSYGKGITRPATESSNLNVHSREHDPLAA